MSLEEAAKRAEAEGNLDQAFDAWRQLTLEFNNSVYFCHLGFVAEQLGKWEEAETAFISALNIEPRFPQAMQGLGGVYLHRPDGDRSQNLALAKDYFLRSLEIEQSARGVSLLGVAHSILREDDAARAAFAEAIRIDPTYEEAYFNLSQLEVERDVERALELLRRALELDPNYSRAHEKIGVLLQERGNIEAAEQHFRRCIQLDPLDY